MYVTDSLFHLQHLIGGDEHDEDRVLHTDRFRDCIMEASKPEKPKQSAEDIKEKMIRKSLELTGGIEQ